METTGIVRRVDDLGRIVIPKEIRSNMRINPGECLQIYSDTNKIVLEKNNILEKHSDYFEKMLKVFTKTLNMSIFLTDTDKVIFSLGTTMKDCLNQKIDDNIYNIILERNRKNLEDISFLEDKSNMLIQPLIIRGDVIGSTIFVRKLNKFTEVEEKIMDIVNNLLINHVEN